MLQDKEMDLPIEMQDVLTHLTQHGTLTYHRLINHIGANYGVTINVNTLNHYLEKMNKAEIHAHRIVGLGIAIGSTSDKLPEKEYQTLKLNLYQQLEQDILSDFEAGRLQIESQISINGDEFLFPKLNMPEFPHQEIVLTRKGKDTQILNFGMNVAQRLFYEGLLRNGGYMDEVLWNLSRQEDWFQKYRTPRDKNITYKEIIIQLNRTLRSTSRNNPLINRYMIRGLRDKDTAGIILGDSPMPRSSLMYKWYKEGFDSQTDTPNGLLYYRHYQDVDLQMYIIDPTKHPNVPFHVPESKPYLFIVDYDVSQRFRQSRWIAIEVSPLQARLLNCFSQAKSPDIHLPTRAEVSELVGEEIDMKAAKDTHRNLFLQIEKRGFELRKDVPPYDVNRRIFNFPLLL